MTTPTLPADIEAAIEALERAVSEDRYRPGDGVDQIRASLSAAILAHLGGGGWRTIESAPKDGTDVLLWWPMFCQMGTGAWMSPDPRYTKHWCRDRRWTPGEDPTYWQPLPLPPSSPLERANLAEGGSDGLR